MADPARCDDLAALAPKMRERVEGALEECHAKGLDARVWETRRSAELHALYYQRGVSKAATALKTWHFYGLAVDVISVAHGWAVTDDWRHAVTQVFRAHGLDWGGDWRTFHDEPHYQLAGLAPSPNQAPRIYEAAGGGDAGLRAVWRAVGAL